MTDTKSMPDTRSMTRLVRHIDTTGFGGKTLRTGDLDGDGAPDFLLAQSVHGTREITCLTALNMEGTVLWQHGESSPCNGRGYSDLPVQIYDWDDDGWNEVLFIRQAHYAEVENPAQWYRERAARYEGEAILTVLDGSTGLEKSRLSLPAPADDSLLFADLTGRGRRQDLVVKDRYWNLWGVSHEGEVLWHWQGSTGHYPAVADIDGDGRDEIFIGFALLDHDGRPIWEHDAGLEHSDANTVVQLPSGEWRLLFGNGGVHCLNVQGQELWFHKVDEAQHLLSGRFCTEDASPQFMVIDRGKNRYPRVGAASLLLYDVDGRELWRKPLPAGSWCATGTPLDWSGNGEPREVLICARDPIFPVEIYNGAGEAVHSFEIAPDAAAVQLDGDGRYDSRREQLVLAADVCGDGRDEVIIHDNFGIRIYTNTRALMQPRHYNATHYLGL